MAASFAGLAVVLSVLDPNGPAAQGDFVDRFMVAVQTGIGLSAAARAGRTYERCHQVEPSTGRE